MGMKPIDPEYKLRSDMWSVIQAIEESRLITVAGEPTRVPGDKIRTQYYPLEDILRKLAVDEKVFLFSIEYKEVYRDINAEYLPGQLMPSEEIAYITFELLKPGFDDWYSMLSNQFMVAPSDDVSGRVPEKGKPAIDAAGMDNDAVPSTAIVDQDDSENPIYPFSIAPDGMVYYKKQPIKMSKQVHALCVILMRNRGRYLPKERLYEVMYGLNEEIPEGAQGVLYTDINKLRDILKGKYNKDVIQTDRTLGYRFKIPD